MIEKYLWLDARMAALLAVPLRLLCKLTGRDSFTFVSAAGFAAVPFMAIRWFTHAQEEQLSPGTVIGSISLLMQVVLALQLHKMTQLMRRLLEESSGAVPQVKPPFLIETFLPIRLILLLVALLPPLDLGSLSLAIFAVALYWLTEYTPPGKSVLARAKERLQELALRVAPAPGPA